MAAISLTALESWAFDRHLIGTMNGQRLRLPIPVEHIERDRVLEDHELLAIWQAIPSLERSFTIGAVNFVKVLLLSGQRLREVANMTWDELDGHVWTIPPERHKTGMRTGKPKEVILVPQILELINALPRVNQFVFAGFKRRWCYGKRLDSKRTPSGHALTSFDGYAKFLTAASGVKNFRFHDFRRTQASWLQDQGLAASLIDATQGRLNKDESGAFRHYGHGKRRSLKMHAMQLWVDHVLGLESTPDVVVELDQRRS